MENKQPPGFIPTDENKFLIWFFKWYTFFLLKFRFKSVYFRSDYYPVDKDSTLILANHNSWWDGLLPLIVNGFVFKQNLRAIVEDTQIIKYPFFSRIGAFSISRQDMKSALYSLEHGAQWLNNPNNNLFVYPEGKITSLTSPIVVENGFSKIVQRSPNAKIVLLTIFISTANHNKPSLYLDVHGPLDISEVQKKSEMVKYITDMMNTRRTKLGDESLLNPAGCGYNILV
jgi:hypothetical protein